MPSGQVVIGPPGSGKTTYCHGMSQFLTGLGREVAVVNLDPANDALPYKCAVDVSELITVTDVMEEMHLGPNGALLYCMEYLEKNVDWLLGRLASLGNKYLLFDLPGQTELYTHHNSVKNIVQLLQKKNFRIAAVHLVDSYYCSDPGNFISVLLTSLSTMLQLELPHVNVLSKADLIEKFGRLAFSLEYYTEVLKLDYLLEHLNDDPFFAKYKKLNTALVGVVEDFSLVSFIPLNIQDKHSVLRVMQAVDKANGYGYGSVEERDIQSMLSSAVGAEFQYEKIQDVQEKYMAMSSADDVVMDSDS